jgi:four helix bundle protein
MCFHTAAVARQIGKSIREAKDVIRKRDAELGDQIHRAVISVALNVSEASRRIAKDRINRFRIAAGSADEIRAALHLAIDWNYVTEESVAETLQLIDRVLALLWRLEHPRKH